MLMHVAGVDADRVAELMLAGGFGNYLSVKSALRIGLIPPSLPAEKIRYVGNAAALGAQLALMSEAERARAEAIAREIEHVSLAAHPDFQDIFVDCMNFPRGALTWRSRRASRARASAPTCTTSTPAGSWRTPPPSARRLPSTSTRTRPDGLVAHPLFPVCYEWALAVDLRANAMHSAVSLQSVHATHDLVLHRLPRAGDRLSTTASVVGIEDARAGGVRGDALSNRGRRRRAGEHHRLRIDLPRRESASAASDQGRLPPAALAADRPRGSSPAPRRRRRVGGARGDQRGTGRTSTPSARGSGIPSTPTARWRWARGSLISSCTARPRWRSRCPRSSAARAPEPRRACGASRAASPGWSGCRRRSPWRASRARRRRGASASWRSACWTADGRVAVRDGAVTLAT